MRKHILLGMIPLLLSTPIAQADEVSPDVFALPDIIVTATKTDMDKKEVPSTVEVITQEDIKARGAHSLKDIMRSAANISLIRSTGRDAISIRGFESRFSTILIDGKRISSEIDQNYELDRISLENVERIEIVRGPASSLYGTDALGGIVNVITKRAKDPAFAMQFDHGRYSSADTNQYQFTFDSGKRGQYGVVISGSQFENDKSLKGNGTAYAPFGKRRNISLRLDYQPTDKETFTLTSSYMDEDTQEYTYKQTAAGATKVNLHDDNERYEYSLSYSKRDADANLFLRAYLSEYYKKTYVYNLTSGVFMTYGESHRTLPGFEARLTQNAGVDHILTYGGEYRPEKFRGTGVRTGQGIFNVFYGGKTFPGSGIDIDYSALYVQDEWQVSPKLLAVTSLRYDDSNQFESNLSPKVGFTYKASSDSRVKLNLSKGFRSPTPNQLYINSSVNRNGRMITLVGNPGLESEKSDSYELSFEQDWGKATGKVTYFTNKMTDMIEEVAVSTTQSQYENISKATIQGVETELLYPLSDRLTWSANYSYLDAVNDSTSTRLYNRPRHKIGTRLAYDSQDGVKANLWCEAYADYLFEVTAGNVKNTAYTLWNMNVEKALDTNTTLILGIENLLNKKDDDLSIQGAYIHTGLRMKF